MTTIAISYIQTKHRLISIFYFFVFSKSYNELENKMSVMANSIHQNQYWLRLVICATEHVNPGLLDVLHNDGPNPNAAYNGIPRDPKLLYIYLSTQQSINIINKLKGKGIIKQDQYELLFPPGCVETDSKKFDPTLNQVLIRNFTTLETDNGWWKLDRILPGDTSVAANAVRAVAFRNFVYHYGNPAAMKKNEFDNKFTEADNILKGMKYTGNINNIKTMTLDPERISVLKALHNSDFTKFKEKVEEGK